MTEDDVILMTGDDDMEYGSEEWRAEMAKRIIEMSEDIPTVGYVNEKGHLILPEDFRD